MTPAFPKTYVVTKEPNSSEGFVREPVIGFVYTPGQNDMPTVVTVQGQRRLIDNSAIMFPCGMVSDPLGGYHFENAEAWLEFTPPKRPGETKASNTTRPEPDRSDEVNSGGYDIEWVKSTFKNNSFWHYDDGQFEFCFVLPGGSDEAPKPSEKCQKIKRDEMDVMKKNIDVLDLDAVRNPDVLPDADPEDEEPGDFEDEGDGEDDLI